MITTYRTALRIIALFLIAMVATQVMIAGSQDDTSFDSWSKADTTTYAETLMEGHDCDTDGALPNAAIVTYKDEVAAIYTTNPKKVDAAFRQALGEATYPNIDTVNALCID